ncbi:unnamed protein product [Cuscuta epithymum]|uniref:Carboxypeptidase n=1 Tax=Cuscuta epithymum TaxID=186058 RepID=A0AAV0CEM2_9ASTE|nr:unnamed protein product [Cuscuta epithymum]
MAAAPSLLLTSSLLLFLLFLPFSLSKTTAAETDALFKASKNSPRSEGSQVAERLIRNLNLFPSVHDDQLRIEAAGAVPADQPTLIEKPFKLDYLGQSGSTLQNGDGIANLSQHAGYFKLQNTINASMFYLFFESRLNKSDPVVIWLTGGPGCGSEIALFYENGPFKIQPNLSLILNDYGWDKISNIIFVDQPIGTGFSYSTTKNDTRFDEKGVSEDLYNFLQAFFNKHHEYVKNDFFITGESYAGHYIPALASRVNEGNMENQGTHINLKGFAIGNGLTDPLIQYAAYTDYAMEQNLINKTIYDQINQTVPACETLIESCGTSGEKKVCEDAFVICTNIFQEILFISNHSNPYDIRKPCQGQLCYNMSNVEKYLNQQKVREALGVGAIQFVSCSQIVYNAMIQDWMRNYDVGIPALLEQGINVLIYAGEFDFICNWLGT